MKRISIPTGLFIGLAMTLVVRAQYPGSVDPDWPCEQVLVPEVPAAVIWAGPPVDGLENTWRDNSRVRSTVHRLTAPGYPLASAERDIESFAGQQAAQRKDELLTLLFAGVLHELNRDRSMMLEGIKRYTRGQSARAERLGETLDEMVRLEEDSSTTAQSRLDALRKQLLMQQRIFDEREEFIQYLCTRPVEVEQRLGVLARSIASHLD